MDKIEKQIEINAPVERVWQALTDYKEFGQWFQVNLQNPFVVGQTTKGNITYPGYEFLIMEVVTKKLDPPTRFHSRGIRMRSIRKSTTRKRYDAG